MISAGASKEANELLIYDRGRLLELLSRVAKSGPHISKPLLAEIIVQVAESAYSSRRLAELLTEEVGNAR